MLLKWIRCQVEPEQTASFARAQEAWAPLTRVEGFLGQCGGWQAQQGNPALACILGIWESRERQEAFLHHGIHDAIVEGSRQLKTLSSWETVLLDVVHPMPGEFPDLALALQQAPASAILRIADCHVLLDQQPAFLQTQREIWLPAMRQADGMLGGCFATDHDGRFLVTTLWRDASCHRQYAQERLPGLRDQVTRLDALPEDLSGYAFPLESAWHVKPPS
jgi:heme-degrading monooxygenase HmoA